MQRESVARSCHMETLSRAMIFACGQGRTSFEFVGSDKGLLAGHLSSPPKYAGLPVVQVSPQSWPPPSTVSVSPVTNFADGPARKTLASATSQGEPTRIIGFERG